MRVVDDELGDDVLTGALVLVELELELDDLTDDDDVLVAGADVLVEDVDDDDVRVAGADVRVDGADVRVDDSYDFEPDELDDVLTEPECADECCGAAVRVFTVER